MFAAEYDGCGESFYDDSGTDPEAPDISKFVIGGWPARPHEFPWQVSLQGRNDAHYCGGFIVDEWHVVTCAHCTEGSYVWQ